MQEKDPETGGIEILIGKLKKYKGNKIGYKKGVCPECKKPMDQCECESEGSEDEMEMGE